MITYILTGANRGLGEKIHDLLNSEKYNKEDCIFITRTPFPSKLRNNQATYVNIDLSNEIIHTDKIRIHPKTDKIIFINNAGSIEPITPVTDLKIKALEGALKINFLGPLQLSQYLVTTSKKLGIPLLILNVSSGAADRPIKGWTAYCTSKASTKIAFNILSLENEHIEVLNFDPGIMDTDMQATIRETPKERMPDVTAFKNYKESRQLKDTTIVASDILEMIKHK